MNLKLTKRIAAIGLAAMMSGCMLGNPENLNVLTAQFAVTASAATASGTCGTNLNWSLSGDTLTITGTGTTMPNYGTSSSLAPWKAYASQIKKVILPKTLKVIGNAAFYKMSALEYVYTANGTPNGANSPCFPDLTTIGMFAFSDCYNFRGNTQSGSLTFGTGAVAETGTLTVGKQAFRNCDQVRFLNAEYKQLTAGEKAFHMMDHLTNVSMSDTAVRLGENVFLNSYNLANVSYKPSTLPIHNTAFNGTAYKTTGCTDADYPRRNRGAATKLQGKQLVVNFFVDKSIVDLKNTYCESRIRTLGRNEHYTPNPGEIVCPFYQYYSELNSAGVYNRSELSSYYACGWNPQKISNQSSPSGNSVITLNDLNYAAQPDPHCIPVDTAEHGVTNGFFGSYVTSDAITERLNDVRDAMDEMQEKAAAYGASFTYEMHPETNFQITYDYFDWTTFSAYETGKPNGAYLGFDYTTAYGGDNPQLTAARQGLPGETHVNGSENDPLFSSIQSASVRLTGEKAQNIQLNRNGNETSAYTQFLKNKYNVDSVIYLVHFNAESQPQTFFQDMDEFSVICDMRTSTVKNNIKHETAHLFGAYDYYENSYVPETVTHFAYTYFGTELMLSNGTAISPVTAFSIGWLDRLNNATYQTFFG